MRRITLFASWLVLAASAPLLAGQAPDSTRADSARDDSASPPPAPFAPTPEQQRYLDGLRRVGRGIAQLKTAVDQAQRAAGTRDTLIQRRAYRRLGGYCSSARSFMTGGRAQMQAVAYEDTVRIKARRLAQRVDDIIAYTRACETEAAGAPTKVSAELVRRLQAYEQALADFRAAIGLPGS
ncbi:MAG TPA: hypothetical protein VNI61_02210 [Gemmatimonadales bacterium]|nr:hypothetical protein [Gemmatimonadales bacterium]